MPEKCKEDYGVPTTAKFIMAEEDRLAAELLNPADESFGDVAAAAMVEPVRCLGQIISIPHVFTGNIMEAEAAITKRLPTREWTPPAQFLQNMSKHVAGLKEQVFTVKRAREFASKFNFHQLKPKTWTDEEWCREVQRLETATNLPPNWAKFLIKKEATPEHKAPRLIVNEDRQLVVANAILMAFVEHCTFSHFAGCHVKHKSKKKALNQVTKKFSKLNGHCQKTETVLVESDGTSWDSTCTAPPGLLPKGAGPDNPEAALHGVLDAENEWLRHCVDILKPLLPDLTPLVDWSIEKRKDASVWRKITDEGYCGQIALDYRIRHSGDRGTSVLNWHVNLLLHSCLLTDEQEKVIGSHGKGTYFRFSKMYGKKGNVYWAFVYEGDDALDMYSRCFVEPSFYQSYCVKWAMCGMRMKFNICLDNYATFVGCHLAVKNGRTKPEVWIPEIVRCLTKAWSTTSTQVGSEYLSFLSRADGFRGKCAWMQHLMVLSALAWKPANGKLSVQDKREACLKHNMDFDDPDELVLSTLESRARYVIPEDQDHVDLVKATCGPMSDVEVQAVLSAKEIRGTGPGTELFELLPGSVQNRVSALCARG